ncbi:MAG: alpha/beta fold hydrolase [Phycisphaerales bacterium]
MPDAPQLTDAERTVVTLTAPSGRDVCADVVRTGAGQRVIFLHGLVGLNEHWEDVVGRIRDKSECLTLELPLLELRGDDCSLWSVVQMTTQFLDRHLEGPSILVGNSFGGHVALRIAHSRPDLVRGLVLAGSSGLIERTMVKGAPVRPSKDWLEEKIGELFYDKSAMNPDDVGRAHKLLNERGGARAMVKLSKTARRDNMTDDLGDIDRPTLLIWGKQDVVTPPSAGQGFTELMPDASIVWLDNCGHAPMLESPLLFADAVRSFLHDLETGKR